MKESILLDKGGVHKVHACQALPLVCLLCTLLPGGVATVVHWVPCSTHHVEGCTKVHCVFGETVDLTVFVDCSPHVCCCLPSVH